MQSPQSTKIRIPLFQHNSEIEHLWATMEEHIITNLMLRILKEIEIRLRDKSFDSAIDLMEKTIKPQVNERRTAAIDSFFELYQKKICSDDTFVTHTTTIGDNQLYLHNLIQEAFHCLKKGDSKEMRKKSVRQNILSEVLSKKDRYYSTKLFEKLNEKYLEVVKDNTHKKRSKKSRSFTTLPQFTSSGGRHKALREWDDNSVELPPTRFFSPQQEPRKFQLTNPFNSDDIFSRRSQSPDTLAYPPTPRDDSDDDNPFTTTGSDDVRLIKFK